MMKNTNKKLIMLFAMLSVCFSIIPLFSFDGFAADGVSMRLEKLEKDFPTGYYYNHKVKTQQDTIQNLLEERNEGYSGTVSRYPCVDHSGKAEVGAYDCNFFDGGYQCHGFASMLFYEIFGIRQSTLEKREENLSDIKPGDLVRLNRDRHSAVVVSVTGDTFTVAESNVGSGDEAESCKIRWGRSYKISDITYYVRAENYEAVSADTDWKKIEDKKDLGSSFYAAILNGKRALSPGNGNSVEFSAYSDPASQVWRFTRQKNGSYKIENCKSGLVLTVENSVKSGKAKVRTEVYSGEKSQLWSFYKSGSKYYLSADCGVSVLVAADNNGAYVNKKSSAASRLFTVKKKGAPEASVLKAEGTVGSVSFSWTKGKNTDNFVIKVYDSSSKLYKKYKNQKGTSLKVKLPAGTYSAVIYSKNAYSYTKGNTVHFTVSEKGLLGKTAKVTSSSTKSSITLSWTSVPGADCYAIFHKTADGWKAAAITEKTKHTFKGLPAGKKYTLGIKACKKADGDKLIPSEEYVTFTAATKLKATAKISVSQTTSAVTLKWSKVENADGYAVYKKTSSGWEKLGRMTGRKYTVKSLSAGTGYTFGVKAYMNTSLGRVYGEMKTVKTATAPKAPVLSSDNIKNLRAKILWNKVSGADGYQVYYKINDSEEYTHLADYKATDGGVELTRLTNGVYYTFAVRAFRTVGSDRVYGPYSEITFKASY